MFAAVGGELFDEGDEMGVFILGPVFFAVAAAAAARFGYGVLGWGGAALVGLWTGLIGDMSLLAEEVEAREG